MKKKIIAILIAVGLIGAVIAAVPIMADPAAGAVNHVTLTPESVALVTGTTQQFTVQSLDSSDQPATNVTYFWLVTAGGGTISSTGLFTAGAAGTYNNTVEVVAVQGTNVKVATASVSVVASIGALDHVLVTPAAVNVAPSGTQQFAAQGYDVNNVVISGLTFSWTGTGTVGTLSTGGLFTAGTTTGTYTVTASATQNTVTKTGSAAVTVTTTPTTTTPTTTDQENHCKSSLLGMFKHYLNNIGADNFMGGQWQVKNSSGTVDTYKVVSGVVQTASATSLTIMPNGQTTAATFTLTTSTVIRPQNAVLAANDKVFVVTINDQVTLVTKIAPVDTTATPPGLNKNNDNHEGKNTPPGWSKGKKMGWNKNSSNPQGSNSSGN